MYAWQAAYWDTSVSHRTPGVLVLAVMAAHAICCSQQLVPVPLPEGGVSNITTHLPPIHSPALDLLHHYKHYGKTEPLHEAEEPLLPDKQEGGWEGGRGTLDPLTLIYDAVMADQRTAQEQFEKEQQVCMTQLQHYTVLGHCPLHPGIPDIWGLKNITVIYLASITGFIMMWIPSTHNLFQCSGEGVWMLGSCYLLCMAGSFAVCAPLYYFLPVAKTVTMAAVHMCTQYLYSMAYVANMSHNSPFYMAGMVSNGYLGIIALGLLVLTQLSTIPQFADYNTAEFYMSHAWALILTEIVRFTVYAPIIIMCGI